MTGDLVKAMRACPQPIIAAIDGVCAGAGAILAMASDLRLGTPRSKTAFLFTRVGLAGCDMGACAHAAADHRPGPRRGAALHRPLDERARKAYAWGFFNRLCAPEALLGEAHGARHASSPTGPTFAQAMTKTDAAPGMGDGRRRSHRRRGAGAGDLHADRRTSAAPIEAFVAKRKPRRFEGRLSDGRVARSDA